MLEKLRKGCEWVSLLAVWFGGVLLILCAFLICIEVLMRKLFNVSTGGADEISSYAFAISTSWAFSFAFLRRAHVRVDALYSHLGNSVRAFLDVLALLALTGFGGFLS
ncbi:MAG: TRAP transporter small permease subunit, partial [Fimbriimonadaceae bacterium]|nr:TRAP transporter small permease subunit [Alphaproteobacteria bacterium]